jgi:hypothetical protein
MKNSARVVMVVNRFPLGCGSTGNQKKKIHSGYISTKTFLLAGCVRSRAPRRPNGCFFQQPLYMSVVCIYGWSVFPQGKFSGQFGLLAACRGWSSQKKKSMPWMETNFVCTKHAM